MGRTKGTYTLTSNIEPKVGAPLDARTVVPLKTDLTANGTFDYPYIGLSVFVREDNKRYTLIGIDPTVEANWREEGSGTSTSADHVTYNNTTSELESTNVQDAIDEVVDNLGSAAYKDVPESGNADATQVVMGNDTRLTDARPASDVSAWAKASTKPTYTASEVGAIATSAKGANNGVAELDSTGKVPSSQLPSFVDDVIEVEDYAHLPITGVSGKIYVTLDTNLTYRWSGTGYTEISASLALGETSSTAYRGDRGKTAYNHATETKLSTATASGLYKVAGTAQGHIASLTAVTKADITALGIPGSDTNTTYTFAGGTNKITVTPSGGTAQDVNITVNDSTKLPLAGGTLTGRVITTKALNDIITGTGTAAQDRGSGDNRYVPAKWTFNTGLTATNGDIVVVKVPVDGHDYGTYMSIDNGTNYYAVNSINTTRLTTQYPTGNYVALIFDSNATTSIYPLNGGTSRGNVTGAWRVFNNYDSGNSDTYNRNRYQATIKADSNGIAVNNIAVGNSSGIFSQLNKGLPFDIDQPILFVERAIAANGTDTKNYDITALAITTTQNITLTAYLPVYIKGTLSGKTFTPVSTTPLTQTIPTSEDNYYYMLLGRAYSTTQIYLQEVHPIFKYIAAGTNAFVEIVNDAYAYRHVAGWSFTTTRPFGQYVTFDQSSPPGGPTTEWFNGFVSSHNNYLASYIINAHRTSKWYVGYGEYSTSTGTAPAPTWYLLLHSGNYDSYAAKKTEAIKNITRSGTTFTATRTDDTTFTFTQQDNNTTYTFANGTNGFTVTPSGGTAQTVTVTPSIANNITGSGTSGYIAKFNGTNTITNGPQLGSSTTTYLRNDGSWATPTDTNTHRPIQVNGTEILGNNTTALNLKAGSNVSLTNSSGTVTIAATDTKYTAGTGLKLDSGAFRTYVPRLNSSSDDSKTIPGVNRFNIREFGNSTLNFPYKEWYHLLTIEGDDSHYATQLALNMTNKAGVYYRKYDNSTWGDWYRLNGALIQKYQTVSTTNKWYKLFTISYSQYNYAYLHLLIKAGYENMYEVFLCLRFTPNGIGAADSYAKIIPYNSSSKNVRLYQVNDTTFGLAVNAQGATSQIGFELLDMSSEADILSAWSLTIANPFTELEAGPTTFGNHRYFTGNYADINGTPSLNYLPLTGGSLTGGLEIKGIIAGDTGSTGHGLWGGGGYHNAYNNIILHGDNQTGTSGIAFVSDKSNGTTITNINQPSDRAFIQYHAYGISTATAESTNPTLATTGEAGRFVVGVGNDSTDQLWLQTPAKTGLIHQVGATSYVIPDTNNTTGTVGSATQPVYVNAGSITATTYSLAKSVPADADFTNTHRPIQVNGTEILGNNTTALNLKAGNNISLSNSSGTITIAATDTNTTYTIATGDSNGQIKVTPSSGSAYNVSVKGLGSNAYTSTAYLPLAGGTLTDNVALKRSTIDAQASNNGLSSGTEYPTTFNILDKNNLIMVRNEGIISSDGNISGYWYIRNYNGSTTQVAQKGIKMTMNKSGTLTYTVDDAANFRSAISAAASSHTHTISQVTWPGNQNLSASATANSQEWSIDLNAGSYTGTYFHIYSGRNSKSILQCFTDSNEVVVPSGNLKVTGGKTYNRVLADMLTGTGTAAQDKGSGVSPRYFPAKWTFNIGIATPADGDIVTIKIPVAGHDFGTFLSLDNGTTYKPISVDYGTGRLTTHYGASRPITLIYDSSGATNSVFAAAGADARSNITGGCWRVMNFWDSGNTYDRNRFNANIMAWGTKILNGNIIVGINGLYHHLKEGTAFDITYPILYLAGDCNASATTTNTYDIIHFTSTTTQNTSWTAYKPVYIKGSLSGNTFTPVSTTPLLQTVPTSEDNYYYMLLGVATGSTTIYLQDRHPIFAYRFNNFTEITFNANYTSYLKPVSSTTTTGFSNWNIPSGSYQVWGQQFKDNRLTYTPSGGSATTVTDTGDWTMWLSGTGTTNVATFNMRIDGTYYGSFSGNLSGNATSANTSDLARRLQWTTVRMTTPNTHWNDAALRYYLSSSAMTTDKPRNLDGKIIHMPWDNDGGYASQMFVAHGQYALAALRCQNGNKDTWGSWMPMGVFSQTTPTSGQVVITDGTNGMIKSSGYTIATSVPSGAVFTDTKNTAGSTDTSSKIFLIGATSQAANSQTYSDNEVYVTSGTLQTKVTQASATICANTANSSTAGGLSLYATDPAVYGVIFRGTGNQGTHGYVTSDWATYFTMSNSDNRGWVFRRSSSGNVASIDTKGRMVLNESVTVGNTTNGGRMEYNSTNHCIDFIVT